MKSNYEEALAAVLKHEGGFSNHPSDPGGATMRGVTQAVYDSYRVNQLRAKQSVAKIADRELQEIYRKKYWDVVRGDDLPAGVDYAVFDYAVNSGPAKAVMEMQRVVHVADDGVLGPITLKAVNGSDAPITINYLCDARLAFLRKLSIWGTFGKGWESRVKGVRALALSMAKDSAIPDPVPPEKPVEADPLPRPLPEPECDDGWWAGVLSWWRGYWGK